ncbi:MAG: BTAD domain-containing putative transcriptional regulator [Sporichthyaceae bacterium]
MGGPGTIEFEVRVLGPVEVCWRGASLTLGSTKQRTLLAALALSAGRVLSVEALAAALWGDVAPTSAKGTVMSLVSRLRGALAEPIEGQAVALRARDHGYVLELGPEAGEAIDVLTFHRLIAHGREAAAATDPEEAAGAFRSALSLWRGGALTGVVDVGTLRGEADRLDNARLDAVEALAEAEIARGCLVEALALLEPHVAAHPLREAAWNNVMLALYRLNRQADALAAYQRLRRILAEHLGVEPGPGARDLHVRILRQSPDLGGRHRELLAFLFTDIEASTRRWESDSAAMAIDLARHDELLREVVADHGGKAFSHTGDGLCAAFSSASEAVAAAVAGQLLLNEQAWVQATPLSVRMAVHAGSAEVRAGTFLGPSLNRVARLLATACGGQIVCSAAAYDLAHRQMQGRIGFLALGERRLADLTLPERVFQATHPQLRSDFPQPAPADAVGEFRVALPASLTPFVGRVEEQAQVGALLDRCRLLTLTGVGGSGKTRLAVEVAAGVAAEYPDGVRLVDLAQVREADAVVSEVVSCLGLHLGSAGSAGTLTDRLCEHLHTKTMLIVLDNCEHVVEPIAVLAVEVLRSCPHVRLLATCREVLGVPGEVTWSVPPLGLPSEFANSAASLAGSDAVALFCQRAAAARPGFAPTDGDAAAISHICRRLDGLPLALELAAAKVRVLTVAQIAGRLSDRFALLTSSARGPQARHQTLRTVIDWSHQLLSDAEQTVLRRLSVFPGDFGIDAAAAVGRSAEDEEAVDVLDTVSGLAEKSLVVVNVGSFGDEARYRLLETVRQYADERLAQAGEALATGRRHRDFVLEHVRTYPTGDWRATNRLVRWTNREEHNIRTALEWSTEEGDEEAVVDLVSAAWRTWYWTCRPEGISWPERALAMPGRLPVPARVEILCGLAVQLAFGYRIDRSRARELLNDALALATRIEGDQRFLVAQAHWLLGQIALFEGLADEARRSLTMARAAYGDSGGATWCELDFGWLALGDGDRGAARDHFERAAALIDDPEFSPGALTALATVVADAGERDRALALLAQARDVVAEVSTPLVLIGVLARSTEVHILLEDSTEAARSLDELLGLLARVGTHAWAADALELAAIVLATVDAAAAAAVFADCDALREQRAERDLRVIAPRAERARAAVVSESSSAARSAARPVPEAIAHARTHVTRLLPQSP